MMRPTLACVVLAAAVVIFRHCSSEHWRHAFVRGRCYPPAFRHRPYLCHGTRRSVGRTRRWTRDLGVARHFHRSDAKRLRCCCVGAATRLCRACDRDVDRPVRIVCCASDPTTHRAWRRGRRSVRRFPWPRAWNGGGRRGSGLVCCGLYAFYGIPSRGGYCHRPEHTAFPRKDCA